MRESIKGYYPTRNNTFNVIIVDSIQKLGCCGLEGPEDWHVPADRPASCCETELDEPGLICPKFYENGCTKTILSTDRGLRISLIVLLGCQSISLAMFMMNLLGGMKYHLPRSKPGLDATDDEDEVHNEDGDEGGDGDGDGNDSSDDFDSDNDENLKFWQIVLETCLKAQK